MVAGGRRGKDDRNKNTLAPLLLYPMTWEVQIRHDLNLSPILSPIQTVGPAAAGAVQHVGARPDQLRSHGTLLPAPAQDGESI